ncbi:hypothetical protein BDZ89DRAFT_1132430 [Hymenopellis radicata]|nr:hypothetical protein BDZ89DRAFT_1132430 [Hymenopellis radicata]
MIPSTIPTDIWDEVFEHCLNYHRRSPFLAFPLNLTHISSFLRKVAHANPKLWSDIVLPVSLQITHGRSRWYVRRIESDITAHYLRLSAAVEITVIFSVSSMALVFPRRPQPDRFQPVTLSASFPLIRSELHRCRDIEFHGGVGGEGGYPDELILSLLQDTALPVLKNIGLYAWKWSGSSILDAVLSDAPNIRRIHMQVPIDVSSSVSGSRSLWTRRVRQYMGCLFNELASTFPNIEAICIIGDRHGESSRLQRTLHGLNHLTSFTLYMYYIIQGHLLESFNRTICTIPTLKELSFVYMYPDVQYHFNPGQGLIRFVEGSSLETLRLVGIPIRTAGLLELLQPLHGTLHVLIIQEPKFETIAPNYSLSPAFILHMRDAAFLPNLKSLHLVWNHAVDEGDVVEMLRERRFDEVSVGRGFPFEGLSDDVKKEVLTMKVACPPVLEEPYGRVDW